MYRRFQEAAVVYVMQIRDSRLSPEAMRLEPGQRKPYIDALMKATTELAQALYEVRLVGTPGPIEAAEAVRQAINSSFDAAAARRESLTTEEADRYAQAMEEFTAACRRDLWYQPPWWQIWRINWWRARRRRAEEPQQGKAVLTTATMSGGIQINAAMGNDVVFGGADTRNAISGGQVIGTVMGPVIQSREINGVVFGPPKTTEEPTGRED